MTGTPMGLLERCHAYKDKKAKGLTADAGLFTYPVLMAADILLYDSDVVPVGEDQGQHVEVGPRSGRQLQPLFGETFVMPKAKCSTPRPRCRGLTARRCPRVTTTPWRCSRIPRPLRKKIMRIMTDSRPMEEPKEPESDHLFLLYSLFAETLSGRPWRPRIAAAVSATARSKRPWPSWRRNISTKPASAGRTWRPTPSGSAKSWATRRHRPQESGRSPAAGRRRLRPPWLVGPRIQIRNSQSKIQNPKSPRSPAATGRGFTGPVAGLVGRAAIR